MIPESVTRTELLEACEPLFALLGIDPNAIFLPFVIGHDSIDFSISPEVAKEPVRPIRSGESCGVVAHHYGVEIV